MTKLRVGQKLQCNDEESTFFFLFPWVQRQRKFYASYKLVQKDHKREPLQQQVIIAKETSTPENQSFTDKFENPEP